MSTSGQVVRYARGANKRRKAGVPDLNVPALPVDNLEHLASVALSAGSGILVAHDGPGQEPVGSAQPALIDLDDFDDDVVVLSSPRAFEEAKNKSRRIRRTRAVVIDVESEESRIRQGQADKRKRGPSNQPIINCELYVDPEGSSASVVTLPLLAGLTDNRAQPHYVAPPSPPPPPPLPEQAFTCPICLGPFVDEVSTKCGHIFCKACIQASIKTKASCPTCRRKVTMKNFFRVYLPTTK